MDTKALFEIIDILARKEIEKTGYPQIYNYEVANEAAEELASLLGVDKNLAKCATALMDIKLGEAIKEKKQPEHVKMSADYAREILKGVSVDSMTYETLINAVEAHHGDTFTKSPYAEIAANADAYRFISERGVFTTYAFALSLGKDHNAALDFVKFKLNEKFNLLSLKPAKVDLEDKCDELLDIINKAYIEEK